MAPRLEGLPPVLGARVRVLVLGSMPGARSLAEARYYAHPRNAFWRAVEPFGVPLDLPYAERCARLEALGVGLWDVVGSCEREGSLDARIRDARVNDLVPLVAAHPELRALLFNGGTARRLFDRHAPPLPRPVELVTMPSTSPANTRRDKVEVWRTTLGALLDGG